MNINYIFLLKEIDNESLNDVEVHYNIFNNIFKEVNKSYFSVEYNEEEHRINYRTYYENESNSFKLSISTNGDNDREAELLDYADKLIRKSQIRKDYNIIITYDGVSEYYANKIYRLLNKFERKLRELIYNILIKTFGTQWYDKTINEELDNKIKEASKKSNKSYLIENALQEMTMYDMEMYLFNPYKELDINKMIDTGEINEEFINERSKEEIANIMSKAIPKSLWERFFKEIIEIENIQEQLEEIRKYRNKVDHGKEFHKDDYFNCEEVVESVLNEIELALEEIKVKEFSVENVKVVYSAYDKFMKESERLTNIYNIKMRNAFEIPHGLKELQEYNQKIQKMINPFKTVMTVQENNQKLQRILEPPIAMKKMQEYEQRLQKMLKPLNTATRMQEHSQRLQKILEPSMAVKKIQEQNRMIQKMTEPLNRTIKIQDQNRRILESTNFRLKIDKQEKAILKNTTDKNKLK